MGRSADTPVLRAGGRRLPRKRTSPVHVLITPSWYPTEENPIYGIFILEQARALAGSGLKVGVLEPPVLTSLRSLMSGNPKRLRVVRNWEHGFPSYRAELLNWFPRFAPGYRWLSRRGFLASFEQYCSEHGAPDIVHAHAVDVGGVWGSYLKVTQGIPLVLTEHATAFAEGKYNKCQLDRAGRVFSLCDKLIAVSPQLESLLQKSFPGTPAKWEWIPNIVDSAFLQCQLGVRRHIQDEFVFLSVANLVEKKGQASLLEAFAASFAREAGVKLWIGGKGPLRSRLERTARELGIWGQVRFLGGMGRHEVIEAMQSADAFVLPSHYETFGVVLVEALAVGCPVVATRCGGPECIVEEPRDGILVEPGDTGALSAAMERLRLERGSFSPESLRMGCQARFGAEAVVARLKQVYQEVLQ